MNTKHLLCQVEEGIMRIQLNRPEALNAFSPEMMFGFLEAIKEAKENDSVKVVVISGAGRSFSAGGDVKAMGSAKPVDTYDHIGKLNEIILAIRALEKPVIAAVHGYAAGAGFNLALACDLIVAAADSKFVLSFSQVGLISDGGGSYFLPQVLGPYRAKELLFSGEPLEVKKAYEWGIVNEIFPPEQMEANTIALAQKLVSRPTKAIGLMKKLVDRAAAASLKDILEQERITQAVMVTTEDHLEGVTAFKEKRKPSFIGK
jgi:2-(1,2-epoxy-1,2-dihydrophenyl)acetyl-CoA isomerase